MKTRKARNGHMNGSGVKGAQSHSNGAGGVRTSGASAVSGGSLAGMLLTCQGLSRFEKEVLELRYGARGVLPYADTAQRLGLSVDTVCQIEVGALQKLRLSSIEARASAVGGWDEA